MDATSSGFYLLDLTWAFFLVTSHSHCGELFSCFLQLFHFHSGESGTEEVGGSRVWPSTVFKRATFWSGGEQGAEKRCFLCLQNVRGIRRVCGAEIPRASHADSRLNKTPADLICCLRLPRVRAR